MQIKEISGIYLKMKLLVILFILRLYARIGIFKNDIANFVKKTDFYNKLKNSNKNVTSNKTKTVLVKNELNELSEIPEGMSTKGLAKKFDK